MDFILNTCFEQTCRDDYSNFRIIHAATNIRNGFKGLGKKCLKSERLDTTADGKIRNHLHQRLILIEQITKKVRK